MTENNVAAQAGDEPMRAALQTVDTHLKCAIEHIDAGRLDRAKLCIETSRRTVQSVSLCATADVEREVYLLWNEDRQGGEWVECSSSDPAAIKFVATTKPGA